jgi:hypothetical protein
VILPIGKVTCAASAASDDPCKIPAAPPSGKKVRIGFFALADNTFATAAEKGVRDTARKYNATVTTLLLNPFNPTIEQSQLRDSIAADKFDAYIVEPVNPPALESLFRQLIAKRIPLTTFGLHWRASMATSQPARNPLTPTRDWQRFKQAVGCSVLLRSWRPSARSCSPFDYDGSRTCYRCLRFA